MLKPEGGGVAKTVIGGYGCGCGGRGGSALSKTYRNDAGTVLQAELRRDSRFKTVFVAAWLVFSVFYVLVTFINSNSNIDRHVLLFFIRISASSDSPWKHLVLGRMADGCLLCRLKRRGNVVAAWIVVIPHWTTVSISTASWLSRHGVLCYCIGVHGPGVCRRLCLLYCPGIPACFRQGRWLGVWSLCAVAQLPSSALSVSSACFRMTPQAYPHKICPPFRENLTDWAEMSTVLHGDPRPVSDEVLATVPWPTSPPKTRKFLPKKAITRAARIFAHSKQVTNTRARVPP